MSVVKCDMCFDMMVIKFGITDNSQLFAILTDNPVRAVIDTDPPAPGITQT